MLINSARLAQSKAGATFLAGGGGACLPGQDGRFKTLFANNYSVGTLAMGVTLLDEAHQPFGLPRESH